MDRRAKPCPERRQPFCRRKTTSNSMEIHTLELPKRPANSDGSDLWDWLKFLSSKTKDEFDSLAGKGGAMAEAVGRLKELSADERARMRADARDKWLWDQAARKRQYLKEGLEKGREEGEAKKQTEIACRLLEMKMPLADIVSATGLSTADVERLAAEQKAK